MFNEKINVAKGFQTSVNIAYDLYNDEKVRNFIPTMSSFDVIEDVLLSTTKSATQRARILIGAYGRGKSHIILLLMSLLFKKDVTLFDMFLKKMKIHNSMLYEFVVDYIKSDKKLLPIIVSGSSASLTQSFLNALQQALRSENLADLMPETNFKASINTIELWKQSYPDTYEKFAQTLSEPVDNFILALKEYDVNAYERFEKLYPTLTSGSTFNPFLGFDVVELYEKVVDKLQTKGYDGVYIIYDEFSKYLESSIASATISDIKLLQDFAEKCDRSGNKQIHLMLICHKDIANYIDNSLPKEKVDGWRGVSGRFKHINLHNNFSQMYEIISAVIKKDKAFWNKFCEENKYRFDDLTQRFTLNGVLDEKDENMVQTAIKGCYPLHPISTFILPRLSEKVAQNERTLFTFLSSDQKYTLSAFLKTAEGDFPMLTPDYIYDYFEPLLRKEPYTSETHKLYKLTSNVLRKVEPDSLGAKIIKTISLIYIIEQFEKLPPIFNIIADTFKDSVGDTKEISKVLSELIDKECIVYLKRSNNYLKLKESSGVDIPGEIIKTIEKNKSTLSVKEILNKSTFDSYMYPTRYNDENEITRYFDFIFIDSNEFWAVENWERKIEGTDADGVVYAIIPNSQEEIDIIKKALLSGQHNHNRIVFVVPNIYTEIEKIAYEYSAVKQLKSLVVDDDLLSDEYDIYIEDLEEVIGSFIFSYVRPETGGAEYFYMGEKKNLYRKAQISALLSDICERIYPYMPIINNESINKNVLPTVAINSRTKLISGLLENELEKNLGLTGTGQDVSIMRSTLIQTGILQNADNVPVINLNPDDANMRNMLTTIQNFFTGANVGGGQSFRVLYDTLTLPQNGIGLKKGVIPIYIAVVLHHCKKNLVIKNKGNEVRITADLLNSINENPDEYSVFLEDWNEEKAKYMTELESIFSEFVIEKEKAYNSFSFIVFAMNRWYMSLPKYVKEMSKIYCGINSKESNKPVPREQKKFINSLRQIDNNSREYLFEKIFTFFGMNEFNLMILDHIKATKQAFDMAKGNLINVLISDVKTIFGGQNTKNASLTSVIKDWYESLGENTINYLFTNNESKILELMKSITNDEVTFMERLGKAVTSLRIDDWNANTIEMFLKDLAAFKETVKDFDKNYADSNENASEMYRIVFVDKDGSEVVKTFSKTKYSDRAKLLFNEITTSLEEMGQAISEQEKRQVLMELLEKMC
ncbi:hypothetical protein ACETAC_04180 [Aceticella autotrophica]|uniref:Uncharacterized protein n=1 Tax=Aceticella autotrophica TaxID=2755338 RepID=A0A975GBD5_9THEO|nr:hypothetical protein [Aceticella autotrophica]QSZ28061.1 hypothetical protein ACETAC_04180 [Aceticella autotrophica]